jgi:hypothetical protein
VIMSEIFWRNKRKVMIKNLVIGRRSFPALLTLTISFFQRSWSSFSTDNLSSWLILFVYYVLKLPVIDGSIVVADFLVVTILTGTTTTAMTKIITMLMIVIRNNFFFAVTWTLKRKLIFFVTCWT